MCVCVFFHLFWTVKFVGCTSRGPQEEGNTGFLIHRPSAAHVFIFHARRIQPFLALVDRYVEFCVLTIKSSSCWVFFFLVRKIPVTGIRTHVPTCQKLTKLPTELPWRPAWKIRLTTSLAKPEGSVHTALVSIQNGSQDLTWETKKEGEPKVCKPCFFGVPYSGRNWTRSLVFMVGIRY